MLNTCENQHCQIHIIQNRSSAYVIQQIMLRSWKKIQRKGKLEKYPIKDYVNFPFGEQNEHFEIK